MKKKVLVVFGTRPEAIKMAPVVAELKLKFFGQVGVCVTAQHREMLDQALDLFEIVPEYDLNVMRPGQCLEDVTSNILISMRQVFDSFCPDMVLVHGDTTTAFAVSLAAFYKKIPVAHVEAGLRTGDIYSPWPEEINRRLVASIAIIHFAPTNQSRFNLINESIPSNSIHVTGNTVIDALFRVREMIGESQKLRNTLDKSFEFLDSKKRLILVTGHRRENFGSGFENIAAGLKQLCEREDVELIYPVHPNPEVKKSIHGLLGNKGNIHLINPLDYLPFVYLMNRAYMVITDSGGIQEEAPSLGKPVLVIRDTTERREAVDAKTVRLVGTDSKKIYREATKLLDDQIEYKLMANAHNPYGDGLASKRIVEVLNNFLR